MPCVLSENHSNMISRNPHHQNKCTIPEGSRTCFSVDPEAQWNNVYPAPWDELQLRQYMTVHMTTTWSKPRHDNTSSKQMQKRETTKKTHIVGTRQTPRKLMMERAEQTCRTNTTQSSHIGNKLTTPCHWTRQAYHHPEDWPQGMMDRSSVWMRPLFIQMRSASSTKLNIPGHQCKRQTGRMREA